MWFFLWIPSKEPLLPWPPPLPPPVRSGGFGLGWLDPHPLLLTPTLTRVLQSVSAALASGLICDLQALAFQWLRLWSVRGDGETIQPTQPPSALPQLDDPE